MPQGMKRFIVSLSIIIIGTMIAWNANGRSLIGVDDAQIYLVYMQNMWKVSLHSFGHSSVHLLQY